MQGLSSFTVTYSGTIRVNAYTADDAKTVALEIIRRDGPDELHAERSKEEPTDREYT